MSGAILSVFRTLILTATGIGFCLASPGKFCFKTFFSVVKKAKLRFSSTVLCLLWSTGEMYISADESHFYHLKTG